MRHRRKITPISQEDRIFLDEFLAEYDIFITKRAKKYQKHHIPLDDIKQETVLRLIDKIPKLRSMEHYEICSYVNYTIKTAYLDLYRKEKRHFHVSMDTVLEQMVGEERDLVPDLLMDHMLRRLRNELTPKEWEALKGKYFIGYSQEELGRKLNIKPNSVRTFLSRVRKKSREILAPEKVTGGDGDD